MVKVSVCSLNCRGLNVETKRRRLFNWSKNHEVTFLQETYITDSKARSWKNDWNDLFFFSPGTNKSNGIITLVKNGCFDKQPNIFFKSKRILGIEGIINEEYFYFINVYAPTSSSTRAERTNFCNELYFVMTKTKTNNVVIGGDFNMVLDNDLDIVDEGKHDVKEVSDFNKWVSRHSLIDSWRCRNPDKKDFTYSKQNPYFCARRLDYIFMNESLYPFLNRVSHVVMSQTDHKLVNSVYNFDNCERGKSYWKLNNSLLHEKEYVDLINNEIDLFSKEPFNCPIERFEDLKVRIRMSTMQYSKQRQRELNDRKNRLHKELNRLNKLVVTDPKNTVYVSKLFEIKKELEIFEVQEARGAMIRSRLKAIDLSEKNNKYFLGVEKSRGANNSINKLTVNNTVITDQTTILMELKNHFQAMASVNQDLSRDNINGINEFLKDTDFNTLSEQEKANLEKPISVDEIGKALAGLSNDSSPGFDGIPTSWYKVFYNRIKYILFECFKKCIAIGELGMSQKLGVISLLHKGKDLRRDIIKNWRPITITNTDYKIFSKCIAIRFQSVLDKIIHPNQTGFMKGRNISDHIRCIDDTINLCNKLELPGMVISLDFEKAFDSISKQTIIDALKIFNFGPNLIKLVETLIANSESCIQNKGNLTEWFPVNKGVRQGDCCAPLLFLLVVEIMAIKIRSCDKITGLSFARFNLETSPIKILQYCDDTSLFLKSNNELYEAIKIIEDFYKISGLRLNRSKSMGLGVGTLKNTFEKKSNLIWKKENELIKILGVSFNAIKEASDIEENWVNKIKTMREISYRLHCRKTSLWGKILLCKTFILSQISYILQSLSLPEYVLKEIDSLCFKFIWSKNSENLRVIERIKRNVVCLRKEEGGAGMFKASSQQTLFLAKWIMKISEQDCRSFLIGSKIPDIYFAYYGGLDYFLGFSCEAKDIYFPNIISRFWKDTIKSWLVLKHSVKLLHEKNNNIFKDTVCQSTNKVPLFFNNLIKFKSSTLFFRKWVSTDFRYSNQIVSDDNTIMEVGELYISESVRTDPLFRFQYNALRTALENYIQRHNDKLSTFIINIKKFKQCPNSLLRKIIDSKSSTEICGKLFWQRKLGGIDVFDKYLSSLLSVQESKMRVLLFKIFHNILPSRILLKKMKYYNTDLCDCGEQDFIEHSLVLCPLLEPLWNEVKQTISAVVKPGIKLSTASLIFGISDRDNIGVNITKTEKNIINNILIIAKFAINKTRKFKMTSYKLCFELEWNLRKQRLINDSLQL